MKVLLYKHYHLNHWLLVVDSTCLSLSNSWKLEKSWRYEFLIYVLVFPKDRPYPEAKKEAPNTRLPSRGRAVLSLQRQISKISGAMTSCDQGRDQMHISHDLTMSLHWVVLFLWPLGWTRRFIPEATVNGKGTWHSVYSVAQFGSTI